MAIFGDGFELAEKEGNALPGGPEGPHSFWAGACHTALAPEPGVPVGGDGVGARQDPIWVIRPPSGLWVNPGTLPGNFSNPPVTMDAPEHPQHCIDVGTPSQGVPAWVDDPNGTPPEGPVGLAPAWRLPAAAKAGTHPDGSATFAYSRQPDDRFTNGSPDNIVVDLPAGFMGDPTAVPKCTAEQFAVRPVQCPASSQVGLSYIATRNPLGGGLSGMLYPVYNLEPRTGRTAEFGIPDVAISTTVRVVGKARTNGDFGVTTFVPQIPAAVNVFSQSITLWGVPWAASHDIWRVRTGTFSGDGENPRLPQSGLDEADQASYDDSWGPIKPFLSNPTECSGQQLATTLKTDAYQYPGAMTGEGDPDLTDTDWKVYTSLAPPVVDCAKPPFAPDIAISPTSNDADSATGLDVGLSLPQYNQPPASVAGDPSDATGAPAHWRSDAGRATAHLDKAVVTLPNGVSINPSGAAGLAGCSDARLGVTAPPNPALGTPYRFDNSDPTDGLGDDCPDGSKIGTVEVDTPLLEQPLTGDVVLGTPESTDPQSGKMFRLFLVLRNKDRGLVAKIFGSAVADPRSGQLTGTFDRNPRVPFQHMDLKFKGGPRAQLATPERCGEASWSSEFTPWTAAHNAGGSPVGDGGAFSIAGNCAFGFAPNMAAGMNTQQGRSHGTFSFALSRQDGEQRLAGVEAQLPLGLLASLKGLQGAGLCSNAQASAGSCPAASRVGTVDAGAGAGTPFFLERKGDAYLTEGYKGGEYGLMVRVPVEAGPFRGDMALTPIVVRQAIHVDRQTAQVRVVSDPFPQIWHGVPLRVREITVNIDRRAFMLNPSDCSPKQVQAAILSAHGARADAATHFQAAGCAALRFKPRLNLRLTGRKQVRTGKHPGVRAVVRQRGVSEAGIEKAVVRLPKSLALDVDNAQALCEFEDGTKPDIEDHCPKGSIVGRARAMTPLLNDDLVGNVYFVKNVRIDKDTGNEIRTLPMIVVALRGEIAVNLVGKSSTTKSGRLVNTFAEVPDAPITRFNLNIKGGSSGILAVTRTRKALINLCVKPNSHIAEADMDGHNGKRHDSNIRMNTPCRKRRPSAAKVCRKRTGSKPAFRRCVVKVKRKRAEAKRRAAVKRKASRS